MLEGLTDAVRNNNPNAAAGRFVVDYTFSNDRQQEIATLHCASKALGVCTGEVSVQYPDANPGQDPALVEILDAQLADIACSQRFRLSNRDAS
ncbi:MAG TPA: hypothetical protein VK674_01565 [Candidatus Limnocylindria bacterium]|nr:hypothetical protein [Candidatus Limnocylindria bacterium]